MMFTRFGARAHTARVLGRVLLAAALVLTALPLARAGSVSGGSGSGKGNDGGTDEGVGSLPSVKGGPEAVPSLVGWLPKQAQDKPELVLEMPASLVGSAIQQAWGAGYVTIEPVPATRNLRLYFHGHVTVVLDRQAVELGAVQAKAWMSQPFDPSSGAVEWNGRWTRLALVSKTLALPLASLSQSGALASAPVTLLLAAHQGQSQFGFTASARGNAIVLSQHSH